MVTQSLCPMVSPVAAARSATDSKVRMVSPLSGVINIVPPPDLRSGIGSSGRMIHLAHENNADHLGRSGVDGGQRGSDWVGGAPLPRSGGWAVWAWGARGRPGVGATWAGPSRRAAQLHGAIGSRPVSAVGLSDGGRRAERRHCFAD